jgi:hypothetical protein
MVACCRLGISIGISAQTVNYNLPLDDPGQVRNLSLSPLYYGFNFGVKALPIGYILFYTGHHISAEVNYALDGTKKDTTKQMANINQYKELDITLAIHLSDRTESVSQKVSVSHHSDGVYNYENYFYADVNARKIKAVRLGYSGFNSYLSALVQDPANPSTYSTEYVNYRTSIFFIGYLSKRIFNYVIDYGNTRTMKRMREFYIDFMLPASSTRDNTLLPQAANSGGNNTPVYHPWGGRIGWMHHSARVVGTYLRLEAGWLPGWQQSGSSGSYYTMLMFGFCFSSGVAKNVQF